MMTYTLTDRNGKQLGLTITVDNQRKILGQLKKIGDGWIPLDCNPTIRHHDMYSEIFFYDTLQYVVEWID